MRILFAIALLLSSPSFAEETHEDEFVSGDVEAPVPAPSPAAKTSRRAAPVTGDVAGTRAKDRFTVPSQRRSAYTYKGQPLEIDPD